MATKEKSRAKACRAGTAQVVAEETATARYLNLLRLIVEDHRGLSNDVLDFIAASEDPRNPVDLDWAKGREGAKAATSWIVLPLVIGNSLIAGGGR